MEADIGTIQIETLTFTDSSSALCRSAKTIIAFQSPAETRICYYSLPLAERAAKDEYTKCDSISASVFVTNNFAYDSIS